MCGIAGVAYADGTRPVERALLAGMAGLMVHRGPDSDGYYSAPGIGFAFRRLSIIDLEGGDQPIANEDGSIVLICNGEIYNFVELRAGLEARGHRFRTGSDVEVILHLYEEHGPDCLRFLRGMFGFALWDGRERRLLLARDRFGIKPLHYAETPQGLYFASEQKPIMAFGEGVDLSPDPQAFKALTTFGYVIGARTPCRGVRRLLPGYYLLYQGGRATLRQYWTPRFLGAGQQPERLSADDWAEALLEKLRESVRLHMRSDVPIGSWLSPGIDSSAVAALAAQLSDQPIHSYTIGFDDPAVDETRLYPTLDRYGDYNLRNELVMCRDESFELFEKGIWYCEEPGGAMIPRLILAEATARRVKVVVNGEGSDELFGGYNYFRRQDRVGFLSRLPLWLRRLIVRFGPHLHQRLRLQQVQELILLPPAMDMRRFAVLYGVTSFQRRIDLLSPDLRAALAECDTEAPPILPPADFQAWQPFEQQQYLEQTIRLPEYVNRSLDRASMAHGLEVRVPFLDHVFAEFCARIPVGLKLRGKTEKYILRQALRGVLPQAIVERRKRGLMSPGGGWWRKSSLPAFAEALMSEAALRRKGLFDPAAVHDLLARHRRGEGRYDRHLDAVLALQLRDELFQPSRLIAQSGQASWRPVPTPAR
ncbi:MAG: asparagine synthase (glutamine-hydrolyzing) [Kiloniellales bacterium]